MRDLFHDFYVIAEPNFVTCTFIENAAPGSQNADETYLCDDDQLECTLLCHHHQDDCRSRQGIGVCQVMRQEIGDVLDRWVRCDEYES